jgi:hypothetical protein
MTNERTDQEPEKEKDFTNVEFDDLGAENA